MTRLTVALCIGFALTAGVATARRRWGNSDAAKACQTGGWQHYVRTDGTPTSSAPRSSRRGLTSDGVAPAGGDFGADYWFCTYFEG
jgi:hypothetical protein